MGLLRWQSSEPNKEGRLRYLIKSIRQEWRRVTENRALLVVEINHVHLTLEQRGRELGLKCAGPHISKDFFFSCLLWFNWPQFK